MGRPLHFRRAKHVPGPGGTLFCWLLNRNKGSFPTARIVFRSTFAGSIKAANLAFTARFALMHVFNQTILSEMAETTQHLSSHKKASGVPLPLCALWGPCFSGGERNDSLTLIRDIYFPSHESMASAGAKSFSVRPFSS